MMWLFAAALHFPTFARVFGAKSSEAIRGQCASQSFGSAFLQYGQIRSKQLASEEEEETRFQLQDNEASEATAEEGKKDKTGTHAAPVKLGEFYRLEDATENPRGEGGSGAHLGDSNPFRYERYRNAEGYDPRANSVRYPAGAYSGGYMDSRESGEYADIMRRRDREAALQRYTQSLSAICDGSPESDSQLLPKVDLKFIAQQVGYKHREYLRLEGEAKSYQAIIGNVSDIKVDKELLQSIHEELLAASMKLHNEYRMLCDVFLKSRRLH